MSMSTSSAIETNFIKPNFGRAFAIWWALAWRTLLWSVAAGAAVGFVEGFVGAKVGIAPVMLRQLALGSGAIIAVPIGIYAVQRALRKQYRGFSIRLLAV